MTGIAGQGDGPLGGGAVAVPASTAGQPASRRGALAGSIGTLIEFYDASLYAYLAPYIATAFFPTDSQLVGLLLTYAVFAIASAMRIVGGAVLGSLGDRFGRRLALMSALGIMTASVVLTALLPTFSQIGIWASLMLIFLRLVQGFSTGGEYAGALVYLIETSPSNRRGQRATLGVVSSGTGALLASFVVLMLTQFTTDDQMNVWGWRIGYAIGGVLAIAALLLRLGMEESATFVALKKKAKTESAPIRAAMRTAKRPMIVAGLLVGFGGIAYYTVLTYLPTYLESVIQIDHADAFAATTLAVAIWAYATPAAGILSDKIGRRIVLFGALVLFVAVSVPAFILIQTGSLLSIVLGELILAIPLVLFFGAVSAGVAEQFVASTRYTGLALGYNTGNAIFGGTAQFVATLLILSTGNDLAPGWYLAGAAVFAIPAVMAMRETARAQLSATG